MALHFAPHGEPPADLECVVCQELPTAPTELCPCGHIFCAACATASFKATGMQCPTCRERVTRQQLPNPALLHIMDACSVRCTVAGCEWTGTRAASRQHTHLPMEHHHTPPQCPDGCPLVAADTAGPSECRGCGSTVAASRRWGHCTHGGFCAACLARPPCPEGHVRRFNPPGECGECQECGMAADAALRCPCGILCAECAGCMTSWRMCPKNHRLQRRVGQPSASDSTQQCLTCARKFGPRAVRWSCDACAVHLCSLCCAGASCGDHHVLLRHEVAGRGIICDVCFARCVDRPHYACRPCDYDLCEACYRRPVGPPSTREIDSPLCSRGHALRVKPVGRGELTCGGCLRSVAQSVLHCVECSGADVCTRCASDRCKAGHVMAPHVPSGDVECHRCARVVGQGAECKTCRPCAVYLCPGCCSQSP